MMWYEPKICIVYVFAFLQSNIFCVAYKIRPRCARIFVGVKAEIAHAQEHDNLRINGC